MDLSSQTFCPSCGAAVPAVANFCPACGKPLKDTLLNTSIVKQTTIYLVSLFLPPFGFGYAWKYLRAEDSKSKKIGAVAVVLTIVALAVAIWALNAFINSVEQSMNSLNNFSF